MTYTELEKIWSEASVWADNRGHHPQMDYDLIRLDFKAKLLSLMQDQFVRLEVDRKLLLLYCKKLSNGVDLHPDEVWEFNRIQGRAE